MQRVHLMASAAALIAAAAALPARADLQKVVSIEGITEFRLDNGLKVLFFPDPSKPTVTVNLTVFVGSRHEGYGETGMAHLLEHMLFKGTPTHPNVPRALTSRGADFNGTTWTDRTNYFETLPASDDNLEFAIRLEADRMVNSFVRQEDLTSEMTVVRNEFERGENSPENILEQRMVAAAYEWHNYGKATIGNRADIERVPIENLRAFYRKFYQPDNAMLVVAGKFDEAKAAEYVQKYFGAIPKPERQLPSTYTEEPPQDGERLVTLRRVGDVGAVGAVYHIPAAGHPDFANVDVLTTILADEPSGRLYKGLVETKKAANIDGAAYAWHDPGIMRFVVTVAPGNDPDVVLGALLDTLEEVRQKGVTEEEVQRAVQRLLKQRELDAADTKKIAIELSEWQAMGDWRLYFLHRDRLEAATADSVSKAAATYLKPTNRTVGVFYPTSSPERTPIPETPDLAALIGDYKGREDIAIGEHFDVSPENIEARTERVTLKSGTKAAFVEKKTRGKAIQLRLTLRYGNVENLKGLATACELLPTLMLRGTKQLSRQELQDELDKHRVRLQAAGTPGVATFTVETRRENFAKALDLLRQVLREATLPEDEFEILKNEQLAGLEQALTEPMMLAPQTVRRKLAPYPPDDPRYQPSIQESIEMLKATTHGDVKKLYDEYLSPEHGQLVIVGDFEADEVRGQIETMLADWKSDKPYEHLELMVDKKLSGSTEEILTPDKANATYFGATAVAMDDSHPDYPALVIGNFVLGGGSLSSRLADRLRQREGLCYGVGATFRASAKDERATLSIFAIANPVNIEKVRTGVREEIERLLAEGITPEELKTAQEGYLQEQEVERAEDANLARLLETDLFVGRTMEHQAQLEAKIRALTTEQVAAAMRKYIDPDKLVIAIAGDLKKAEQAEGK